MSMRRSRAATGVAVVVALLWLGTAVLGRSACVSASKGAQASSISAIAFPLVVLVSYRHACGPECGYFGRDVFLWLPGYSMLLWRRYVVI